MLNREREVPVKEKKNLLHDCGVLILYALHSYAFASKGMTIGIFKDGSPALISLPVSALREISICVRCFASIDAGPAIAGAGGPERFT